MRRAHKIVRVVSGCILALGGFCWTGCARPAAQAGPPPQQTPEVLVATPIVQEVTDYEDFPGRTAPVHSVEIRARVTGYLDKVHFKEGDDVGEGDLLFEIDPRWYKAELNRAKATLNQAQAHLSRLKADYERASKLRPKGIVTQEQFDRVAGDRDEALAAVDVAQADRDLAELNLSYTKILAPFGGRISSRFIDPGNLVKADDTILTSIVSYEPMYAYFDLDERTTLKVQRLVREGVIEWSPAKGLPVFLGLPDETGYPREGTINFADNRVDPDTGTWRLRGKFDNPENVLSPGLIVHMRLPIGAPYRGLLVAEQALGADQGQKFVYVVDQSGKVEYRRVQVGSLHQGLRVVTDGLQTGEQVIVSGLQRARPGAEVNVKVIDMLEATAPPAATTGSAPPAGGGKTEGAAKKTEAKP